VHTIDLMNYDHFDFEINGEKGLLEDIFPGFNEKDRIGVVVRQAGGGMGASALLMAALTRFYDFHRPKLGDEPGYLRIYPENFVFHVGKSHMDHSWMDIWPPHKEVVVEDDPEQILEAINDRGITRLLVPDSQPSSPTFLRETLSSAKYRIISTLAYSPSGRVHQNDITILSCAAAEGNVIDSLNRSDELAEDIKEQLRRSRTPLYVDGRVKETYRRINLSEALQMLSPNQHGTTTHSYMNILGNDPKYTTSIQSIETLNR
jgi:hypothetical protein